MLQDFLAQIDIVQSLLDTWNGTDQATIAETTVSIRNLKLLAFHEMATEKLVNEPSNLLLWPAFCTTGVMRLFHTRKAPAIAILAYYAFILDSTRWSLANWRSWLFDAFAVMEFEEPWMSVIRWPIDRYQRKELPQLIEVSYESLNGTPTNHDVFQ